ncbi:MAG TPA: glycosyltransferase family 39 protein [Candidatus Limnocylindria bacterium]|nr:glycosyltransferase family 39 protein [Candidatus Limnocylindria bacterium]
MRPPFLPIFLSLLYRAGVEPMGVLGGNVLLAGFTAWLLYRLSRRVGLDDRSACIAVAAYLVYPPFSAFTVQLVTENLFIPLILASTLMVLRALDRRSTLDHGIAGVLLGLAALTRPTALLLPIVLAVPIRRSGSRGMQIAALLAASALVVTPWVVRNHLVFGHFQPTATSSGRNLYTGTYPPGRGRGNLLDSEQPASILAALPGRDEFGVDSVYAAAAVRNLREYPMQQIPLAASKLVRCWFQVSDRDMFRPTPRSLMMNGPLLALGVIGWYGLWKRRAPHPWVPVFMVAYSMFVHVTSIATVRYNLMSWPFVFMGVGVAVMAMAGASERFRLNRSPPCL